jgi:hypothetical protein
MPDRSHDLKEKNKRILPLASLRAKKLDRFVKYRKSYVISKTVQKNTVSKVNIFDNQGAIQSSPT